MTRTRLLQVPAGLALAVGLLIAGGCGSTTASRPPAPGSQVGTTLDMKVPSAIGSLRFIDPTGHRVTLDSFKGKTVVISDSMTLCGEDCPLDTANVVAAARASNKAGLANRVEFLTITVDPQRDDSRHLRAYRTLYDPHHKLKNWQLLTATPTTIAQLWKHFGVYYARSPEDSPPAHDWLTGKPLTYDIQHADQVIMLDPHGNERLVISGHAHVPNASGVPRRMRAFLTDEGDQHLYKPGRTAWTPQDVLKGVAWLTGPPISE